MNPRLRVKDIIAEPLEALKLARNRSEMDEDASIQREILGLLRQLNQEMGLTILFITHDLSVVGDLCDEVLVLLRGRLVEQGSVKRVFLAPQEHYTRSLLAAVPTLRGRELLAV
ncbi:MAG: putative peptide transport fused subunit of superfamily: ATP-binding component [Desulfacinum sp.]|nr:putative peptide transport fused subunit of superfamily: ATP-binding component [Desulfacinum sp.]